MHESAIIGCLIHLLKPNYLAEGHTREAERNRRAVLTGSVAALDHVVQIGTSLITIPLTLKYLGNERSGLWLTIRFVLVVAAFADFGVRNTVLSTVSNTSGTTDCFYRNMKTNDANSIVILPSAV